MFRSKRKIDYISSDEMSGITTLSSLPLIRKFKSALRFVKRTYVFGSGNKTEDIERTSGSCLYQSARGLYKGEFFKQVADQNLYYLKIYNQGQTKLSLKKQLWTYCITSKDDRPMIGDLRTTEQPLYDPQFNLEESHKDFLLQCLFNSETKQGNCMLQVMLCAKYLWENHSGLIKRIEAVKLAFNHVILVINREGDLPLPKTWGDAWIIDPWFKDGVFYHATKFFPQFYEVREYVKKQLLDLAKLGLPAEVFAESDGYAERALVEIKPEIHKYPTYQTTPFKPIEDYYEIKDESYGGTVEMKRKDKAIHQYKFDWVMKEINVGEEAVKARLRKR